MIRRAGTAAAAFDRLDRAGAMAGFPGRRSRTRGSVRLQLVDAAGEIVAPVAFSVPLT